MPGKLEVSFNSPQCGWMSIGLADGENEFHTTTAHAPHELALPELLQILTAMLGPDLTQNAYLLKWNRDPEEFDFSFVREGDAVTIEVYEYPTDQREPGMRELVFSHTGGIGEVCEAFAATFEQLYRDRDTDEFEFNWRQPFPLDDFAAFKSKLEMARI